MCKLSDDKLSGRLQLKYLEDLVVCLIRPEPEVFDGHATAQVLSFADVRESAVTADLTDTYALLP